MATQNQFISASQLLQLQNLALLGMITTITIESQSEGTPDPGNDYGDDILAYSETSESRRQTVKGWLYSTPTPTQEIDTGAIVTANTYRLLLPVGTQIEVRDIVTVGSQQYIVSDTDAESTWLPMLTCSLRKRE